jgi:hypothetical protein
LTSNKDSVSIIIKDPPKGPYYCNLDYFKLHLQNKDTGEYISPRCGTTYFPNLGEKIKRASKFETPGGPTDAHGNIIGEKGPLLSLVNDDSWELSSVYGQQKLPASFEMLKKHGLKITSWEEGSIT